MKTEAFVTERLEPGVYITGQDEQGCLLLLILRRDADGSEVKLGAVLFDLGGVGVADVAFGIGVDAERLHRWVTEPFVQAGQPLVPVSEEAAATRMAVAERVTRRRGNELPESLVQVREMLSENARRVRERTLRQLEEEESLAALPPAVLRRVLRDRLSALYSEWTEDAIPALGGMTPRMAWNDPAMRLKVEEVLDRVARVEDMRLKGIGVAFDAERLRQRLGCADGQRPTHREVETEIADVLMLAQVPAEERFRVYDHWWRFVESAAPRVRNPRPWAAALYKVMTGRARLVPLTWDELERLFEIKRRYAGRLVKRIEKTLGF